MSTAFRLEEWQLISEVFQAAAELPVAEQEAAVVRFCGDRADLAPLVLEMLAEDRASIPVMDDGLPAVAFDVLESLHPPFPSMNFGPYQLLRVLGEGGMGVVYLAEHKANGMLAAIKILGDARLSPARRERFANEQKILATLDHPHIARLYHADVLDDGTPWFAMEYVGRDRDHSGALPLNEFCEQNHCSLAERLRLFADACAAMQYVHGKMVVHRDLKPGNILVSAEGVVKVIDFGIGKEISDADSGFDLTIPGLRLMTIAYAAPEQVRGAAPLPSGDIYALGVILYQLLSGVHPFDVNGCTATEVERRVTEGMLVRPSTRARATGHAALATAGAWRDLDALCLKAMHREEERRYASAEALLRDVRNFLDSRPLHARPDGVLYRSSKYMRRNWQWLTASLLVVLAAAGSATYYTIRLRQARDTALAEAARTQRVEHFMLDLMTNNESDAGPAEDARLATLAERGVKQARLLENDPEVQADLYDTLGTIYQAWGKSDLAWSLLKDAQHKRMALHGAESLRNAESLLHMGMWKQEQDQIGDSEKLLREALAIEQAHPEQGSEDEIQTLNGLAILLQRKGDYRQSVELVNRAFQLEHATHASLEDEGDSITTQANNYYYMGDLARSEQLNLQGLAMDRRLHGNNHPDIAEDLINLGNIETMRHQFAAAERDFRPAVEILRAWYGPNHSDVTEAEVYLAQTLADEQKYSEAKTTIDAAIAAMQSGKEPASPRKLALAFDARGKVEQDVHQFAVAEQDYQQSVRLYEQAMGANNRLTLIVLQNLATIYLSEGKLTEAERILRDALQRCTANPQRDPLQMAQVHLRLGRTLHAEKQFAEAARELQTGIEQIRVQQGVDATFVHQEEQELQAVRDALRAESLAKMKK